MLLSGAPAPRSSVTAAPQSPPGRPGPPQAPSTGQQCTAGMARWIKEHLGFKSSTKPAPPAPPRPDYRHGGQPPPGGPRELPCAVTPAPQPDIVSAYKLQKERDFEDPYSPGGRTDTPAPGAPADGRFLSPKHRLIKVEAEKVAPPVSPGSPSPGLGAANNKTPTSPPPEAAKPDKVVILEDYADPFDAKQTSSIPAAPEKVTENDGYMEPYEAQKMMAEIRRRGSKDAPVKPLHLYDTPYEPTENGVDSDPEKSAGPRPRESRLPEDDERPPEEYDQPWEWKKDRISKAFAVEIKVIKDLPWPPPVGQLDSGTTEPEGEDTGPHAQHHHHHLQHSAPQLQSQHSLEDSTVQFDGVDKNRMSPSKEEKVRHSHRHSSGNLKSAKHPSLEHTGSIGERIDPTLPLENQFWYHGAISRIDAENLLRLCREASYLVRNSETSKNDFSLSLKSNQGFMHMKLSRTKESKYILGQNSLPFDSVPEIIHHYASRKLPIKGAEHMSLLYPVAIRTL
ncbi:SH2 domain-containing adapter protein F isoform X1 [Ambystoma mexicanum]|uniref:SH2 domain-containing adapter protein F isoform X1 n=1 Tax=Ambystoma mexicanum TaxID=8296 RepID=UPI0037E96944